MPRYTYTGDYPVIFSHYLDVSDPDKPVTLTAEPGQTYDIKQADSPRVIQKDGQFADQELPMPPDASWEETSDPTTAEVEAKKADTAAKTPPSEDPPPTGELRSPEPKPAAKKKEQADA
jgi:hypothetical protein